jgi:putative NADPH-quinone reductase
MKHLKLICVIIGGLILALVGMSMKNSKLRKKAAKTKSKLNKEIHENKKEKLEDRVHQTVALIKDEKKKRTGNKQVLEVLEKVKKKELQKIKEIEKIIIKEKKQITDIDKLLEASKKL